MVLSKLLIKINIRCIFTLELTFNRLYLLTCNSPSFFDVGDIRV